MSKVRFVSSAILFSVVVWLLSFWALAAPTRIFHFEGNKYLHILSSLFYQSFVEADEELITLTCLTLWALTWGVFLAAFALSRRWSGTLKWSSICGAVVFAAWFVGAGFLRHLFSVEIDHYFHIAYSLIVATVCSMLLIKAVREPTPTGRAASANNG